MKKAKKIVALLLCAVLLVGASVVGTVAYLTDKADVTNTFTAGNVTIELKEYAMDVATGKITDSSEEEGIQKTFAEAGIDNIKILPGRTIEKQPVVIVNAGSEKCWLFVKVENGDAKKDVLGKGAFTCSDGWTVVNGQSGWYQYEVAVTAGNYQVFENFIFQDLTNEQVDALTGGSIKVTAYAVQEENLAQTDAFETASGMAANN